MRRLALWLVGLASVGLLGGLLGGCGPSGGGSGGGGGADGVTFKSAPTGEGELKGKLEVQAFKGGYGIDFYQKSAEEFASKHPGLEISVDGNPRVWEQLRPRFVGGDPPDLVFPGWGMDHWALAEEGQLMTLDAALDSKPHEGEGTWRDTFEPVLLAMGQSDGKQFVLPYYFNVLGWWYDPNVFAKHGWTPPKTYDELLVLGEKIKAAGMAPITFQGQYPYYMIAGMLMPWVRGIGGKEATMAAQNLEPGAWKSPAMLEAVRRIDELNKKGFFQRGAAAMSHTEAQQEFLQGKAAMIPCGTWLYSEMKNVMPPNAKMEYMLPPAIADGKGDPTAVLINIEPWMVPSDAKNPNAAVALFKYMTSASKAKQFVQEKATLMAIKGSSEGDVPAVLHTPAKAFRESKDVWSLQFREWYPKFHEEVENALQSLVNGSITPEQFCDRVEKEAEKTRNDASIKKHKVKN